MGDDGLGSKPSPGAGGSPSAVQAAGMTVEECQGFIQQSFKDPTVRFLREHLAKSGCSIGTNFVRAVNCKERIASRFVRGSGIEVCGNHLIYEEEVLRVVVHELIRAYDDCRVTNFDCTNCAHLACSEIRATNLSGDCNYKLELLRGHVKMRGHGQECVKRRAMEAVTENPLCSKIAAKDAIEAVWNTCYNDTAPFDRAP